MHLTNFSSNLESRIESLARSEITQHLVVEIGMWMSLSCWNIWGIVRDALFSLRESFEVNTPSSVYVALSRSRGPIQDTGLWDWHTGGGIVGNFEMSWECYVPQKITTLPGVPTCIYGYSIFMSDLSSSVSSELFCLLRLRKPNLTVRSNTQS